MTTLRAKKRIYQPAIENEIADCQNPRYLFSGISISILTAIVKGEIDPAQLAKNELQYRGLNENGAFVGWQRKKH